MTEDNKKTTSLQYSAPGIDISVTMVTDSKLQAKSSDEATRQAAHTMDAVGDSMRVLMAYWVSRREAIEDEPEESDTH